MSLFVQDVFAEARRLSVTTGFVGTFADLKEAVATADYDTTCWDPDEDGSLAYERYLESGWPGADQYRWEEEQDRLRNPYDPQSHYLEMAA